MRNWIPAPMTMPRLAAAILLGVTLLAAGCSPIVRPDAGGAAAPPAQAPAEAAAEAPAQAPAQAAAEAQAAGVCTPGAGSIAVLLPESETPRWEMDDRRFLAGALAAAGVPYTVDNAGGDGVQQVAQAQAALLNGAKVLILTAVDSETGAAVIQAAHATGAYVIDYDRLTVAGMGADAAGAGQAAAADLYVSFDNVLVGSLMAQTLEPLINGLGTAQPQVVQLNGAATDNNAALVRAGYSSVATPFYDAGRWGLAADVEVPNWDGGQARDLFSGILSEAGDEGIDAVFAANDVLAAAVVQVLKAQGHAPVLLSGQDATVEALQNILAGWQTMTVYKPIQQEASTAVVAALALLNCEGAAALNTTPINNGAADVPSILLEPAAVTKDNIAATVIADGFRTWDELCAGEYEQFCPPAAER